MATASVMINTSVTLQETGIDGAVNNGGQLAPYAWGAADVILVIGAQKLVPGLDTARRRISQHGLKLEVPAQAAYGQHSYIGKVLEIHQELPGRIRIVQP